MDNRRLYLVILLRRASEAAFNAGLESEARKLRTTPVNIDARLACLFKSLRTVETAITAKWGRSLLSGSRLASAAAENLILVRAGAVAALSGEGEKTNGWMRTLIARAELRISETGHETEGWGAIEKELEDESWEEEE